MVYSSLTQIVENKGRFIGGVLLDSGDAVDGELMAAGIVDPAMGATEIEDVVLEGDWFEVCGRDYSCGLNTEYGRLDESGDGWVQFRGYMGHIWRIHERKEVA